MADGVAITAGTGTTILTDDCTTGHAQIVKLAYSGDGVATAITADANGLEVQGAGTAGTAAGGVVSVQGVASGTVVPVSDGGGILTVDGTVAVTNADITTIAGDTTSIDGKVTACNTGAVTVAASALPSGASSAAKQPALGTAGTPSADVITVQGVTSMTALKVDGSAATQPVSGTVAVTNAGITSIDGKITACNTGAVVLAAGTAEVGKLAAGTALIGKAGIDQVTANANEVVVKSITAGDNNIGNVDIVTMPADTFAADAQAYGKGVLAQGDDGTDRRAILVGTDGHVQVDVLSAPSTAVTNAGITTIAGAVAGTEMQVDVLTMPSTAVTNADITSCKTALELLDNSVDGNYLNVNVNAAGTDLTMNAGVLTAQTQRVTIATDDEVNNLLGTIDADTSTLAGAVAGTEMQCDVLTMPSVAVTNAGITTIAGAVAGTEMQVDVVAALPAGTNAIGKLASNTGVDIGDVDVLSVIPGVAATNLGKAEDAGHTSGDVGVMALGVANTNLATAGSGTTGDYTFLATHLNGALYVLKGDVHVRTRVTKNVDYTASQTGTTVWDPTGGTSFIITHITVSATGSGALTIFDNTDAAGSILFEGSLSATGGWDADYSSMHWKSGAADNILKYTSGAGATGSIAVTGYEI